MATSVLDRALVGRVVAIVVISTIVLTASFIGLLALITGDATGIEDRFAGYTLGMAVVFVVSLLLVENRRSTSTSILATTIGLALTGFVIIALGGEGIVYSLRYPERVFASQLVVYFAAAGLICTGLGYWGLKYWREFTPERGL